MRFSTATIATAVLFSASRCVVLAQDHAPQRATTYLLAVALAAPAAVGAQDATNRLRARGLSGIFDNSGNKGGPASQGQNLTPWDSLPSQAVPAVDRARVKVEDAEREANGLPPRFAIQNKVDANPKNGDGTWEVLPDGTQVWRYRVKTQGCNSLNFGFMEYEMPQGGKLFIYDSKGETAINRPFTSKDNGLGQLWTPVIESCDVTIEVNLDGQTDPEELKLALSYANVGYRGFGTRPEGQRGRRELSGSCNVDVVCSASDGYPDIDSWRAEIPSVAVYSTGGSLFCTGAMINNARNDRTPYFLTANHCGIGNNNAGSLVTYWNYETSSCQGNNPNGSLSKFLTGAVHLVSYSQSDVTLVRLNQEPDRAWEISYAGWDNSGDDATSATAIHHPSCDEKRISFENQPTTTTSYGGTSTSSGDTHVRVADWDMGTTEPGSSGSPLFNQNHHIIGQLHGGDAACDNNSPDWYGKFAVSWINAGLAQWLDPDNTGAVMVDTLLAGTNSPTSSSAPSITLTPTNSPTVSSEPTPSPTTLAFCLSQPGTHSVKVNILTDNYPAETSWTMTNTCVGAPAWSVGSSSFSSTGTLYTEEYCVSTGEFEFTIFDSFGDGICCRYGSGEYSVSYDGVVVRSGGDFSSSESTVFGSCTPPAPTTSPPTGSPTPCTLADVDESCADGVDCCSGLCSGGKPSSRVCVSNGGPTPTPPPPSPGGCDGFGIPCGNCCNGCQGGNGPNSGLCK